MLNHPKLIGFLTLARKEIRRIIRLWAETVLPSAMTMVLYFVIFGKLIGSQLHDISGYNYMQYIAPGLIMMSVITTSYTNVAFSFFIDRFHRSVEAMLVAPMPNALILAGYVIGGMFRAVLVGSVVAIVALGFTHLHIHHLLVTIMIVAMVSGIFSLAGFINASYATDFDHNSILPTFILTPLSYFGGVFYSITMLPDFWQHLSRLNPILYMVNTFRYGILGVSDVNVTLAFGIMAMLLAVLTLWALYLLDKGKGIKN